MASHKTADVDADGSTMPNGQIIVRALSRTQKKNRKRREHAKAIKAVQAEKPTCISPPLADLLRSMCDGSVIDLEGRQVRVQVLHRDPPIFLFHNLLTASECEAIVKLGGPRWTQSSTLRLSASGTSSVKISAGQVRSDEARTSQSAMVNHLRLPALDALADRLRLLTGVPHCQTDLVKYEPGQYFRTHHDGAERKYTFVVYLNDLLGDDDGGETEFPTLSLCVKPRLGSALFFANRKQESDSIIDAKMKGRMEEADERVVHAALPVHKTKVVLNVWMIDEPGPMARSMGVLYNPTIKTSKRDLDS